jgi:hypothetical protein
MRPPVRWPWLVATTLAACQCLFAPSYAAAAGDPVASDARIARHLAEVCATLDPRAAATLERIDGLGPRLLAARSYLRVGAIGERWSWSQAEIDRYQGSALQRALDAEIDRVRAVFEKHNPGYTLWVNPQVRSVEVQLQRWNENATVAAAGASMLERVRRELATAPTVDETGSGRQWLESLLRSTWPTPTPTLAAPGLSRHGRMQAVDFQVKKGDTTVAGPSYADVRRVWEAQGWAERLRRAVRTAGDRFKGPLTTPNEPWHYEYAPGVASG